MVGITQSKVIWIYPIFLFQSLVFWCILCHHQASPNPHIEPHLRTCRSMMTTLETLGCPRRFRGSLVSVPLILIILNPLFLWGNDFQNEFKSWMTTFNWLTKCFHLDSLGELWEVTQWLHPPGQTPGELWVAITSSNVLTASRFPEVYQRWCCGPSSQFGGWPGPERVA
jgi:hypothetical protein